MPLARLENIPGSRSDVRAPTYTAMDSLKEGEIQFEFVLPKRVGTLILVYESEKLKSPDIRWKDIIQGVRWALHVWPKGKRGKLSSSVRKRWVKIPPHQDLLRVGWLRAAIMHAEDYEADSFSTLSDMELSLDQMRPFPVPRHSREWLAMIDGPGCIYVVLLPGLLRTAETIMGFPDDSDSVRSVVAAGHPTYVHCRWSLGPK
jgi:hypothetical protein